MLAPPPGELAPPPRGNPGSATEYVSRREKINSPLKYLLSPPVMLLLLGLSFALFAAGFAGPVEVRQGKAVKK